MILRSLLLISFFYLSPIGIVLSDEIKLNHDEIKSYLHGKTVVHRPGGKTEFHQTFNTDGTTTYKAAGRNTEQGKWSIQGNQYCSQWRSFGWTCYNMTAEGNLITWIAKEGTHFPGVIIEN
ncbi:hypothetical protein [Kiloniella antarctica]|uniref:Dihydrodipicolinate reductase n=1 Tax=Kiloniella antarctica TaxID=1550907 RepID=A0ABW5BTD0_9PROT